MTYRTILTHLNRKSSFIYINMYIFAHKYNISVLN